MTISGTSASGTSASGASALWTSAALAAATQGTVDGDFAATAVSIDTRSLPQGAVYVALQGVAQDGHAYVAEAFAAGAVAAVVRDDFQAPAGCGPLLRVKDTLQALQDIGRAGRARARGKIIGVTGSAGKTGTKELLAHILSPQGKTYASRKSYNNHWGVPLSLANVPADADFGIFEMGMNHAGELAALSAMVQPHIALITTIEPAHIEHFGTVEAIADAKGEVFAGMADDGYAVLNIDNPHFARLNAHAAAAGVTRVLTFGEDAQAFSRMTDCVLHADSSRVTGTVAGAAVRFRLNIPGRHIALNAMAALAVVHAAGADVAAAAESLKTAEPVAGRGNHIVLPLVAGAPPVVVIDETYNANPASMAAAIAVLEMTVPQEGGRRVAVLGDMLELGREGPALHAALANPLLRARTDKVFCCGPQMDALYQLLPPDWRGGQAANSQVLAEMVTAAVQPGDVVLVKGSLGSKMAYVVQALIDHATEKTRKQ